MGQYHKDEKVEQALIKLNDEICSWERSTSREVLLMVIPFNGDEKIHISMNGKPMEPKLVESVGVHSLLERAMKEREKSGGA